GSATLSSPSSFFIVVFQIPKNKETNVRSHTTSIHGVTEKGNENFTLCTINIHPLPTTGLCPARA
ncbi:hypothetical protein, partial [Bacillus pseudomycoides]|uniref:hypothetical protein n=1 Tax=Bacillus pseudomycoides TaxID=64104 RepID=UPI001C54E5AA